MQLQANDATQFAADEKNTAKVEADRLFAEQKEFNTSMNERLTAIAVTSAKTAKTLSNWDGDGQPEVRNVS